MPNRLLFMLFINLKLKRETYKFSPNNSTHTLNSHVCSFPSTRFYTADWNFGREHPRCCQGHERGNGSNLADPIPALRKQDRTFLSVQQTCSWEVRIMGKEEKNLQD